MSRPNNLPDDNFFLSCWLALKSDKPRLRSEMDRIELLVAGLPVQSSIKKRKHADSSDSVSEPEPSVL